MKEMLWNRVSLKNRTLPLHHPFHRGYFPQPMWKPGFQQIIFFRPRIQGNSMTNSILVASDLDGTIPLIFNNFALSRCTTAEWKMQKIHSKRNRVWVQVLSVTSGSTVSRVLNFYSICTSKTRTTAIPT